jgi:hypothetical protein
MKYIFYISILLFVFTGCKKHDEYEKQNPCGSTYGQTMPLSSDLSNFKYKPGTYWILQDSLSGSVDSVFVTGNTEGLINTMCGKMEYYTFNTSAGSYTLSEYSSIKNSCDRPVYPGGTFHDSLYAGNQYFYNVYESRTNDCSNSNYVYYFMNNDSGFIKIDTTTSNYQLLSRKILQRKNIVR